MPSKKKSAESTERNIISVTREGVVVTAVSEKILVIRGQPVIVDSYLAGLYEVETKALNRAVFRNLERFPDDFSFVLSPDEWQNLKCQIGTTSATSDLKSQIVTSSAGHGGRRKPPRVFTEHGALMASTVLRSDAAVRMSSFIIRAFVKMREELASNSQILRRLAEIDKSLMTHDAALRDLYQKLRPLLAPPPNTTKREMGFHAQP